MIRTYILVDPSAPFGPPKPFYIGCGFGARPKEHFRKTSPTYFMVRSKKKIIDRLLKKFIPEECIRYDRKYKSKTFGRNREVVLISRYGTIAYIKSIEKGLLVNKVITCAQRTYIQKRNGQKGRKVDPDR